MSKKEDSVKKAVSQKPAMEKVVPEKEQIDEKEVKFINVAVDVIGQYRSKNYIDLKGLSFNSEKGHLAIHLNENHTMIFKDSFQKDYLKVVAKEADKVELAVKKAPKFENGQVEKSQARMRFLGERDGRTFVGPTGSVKYDGSVKGFVINLDDKHSLVVDSEVLSRDLGIKFVPMALERNLGLAR